MTRKKRVKILPWGSGEGESVERPMFNWNKLRVAYEVISNKIYCPVLIYPNETHDHPHRTSQISNVIHANRGRGTWGYQGFHFVLGSGLCPKVSLYHDLRTRRKGSCCACKGVDASHL